MASAELDNVAQKVLEVTDSVKNMDVSADDKLDKKEVRFHF